MYDRCDALRLIVMQIRSGSPVALACMVLVIMWPAQAGAAKLDPRTLAAYEQYTAEIEQAFRAATRGANFIDETPSRMAQLRNGQILAGPGGGDGIMSVTKGLIHHWRAVAFIPGVNLEAVLKVVQDYSSYSAVYDYVTGSETLGRAGDSYQIFLRLKRSAAGITGVVDVWMESDFDYPGPDRAASVATAACVKQVERAGEQDERRLPEGTGSGYLWRADVLSRYLERDGGVYMDIQTIGLSRGFPPLLGWIVEPIVRRLGRGSAEDSLKQLRRAVLSKTAPVSSASPVNGAQRWCGQ